MPRTCIDCHIEKPLRDFNIRKRYCQTCEKIRNTQIEPKPSKRQVFLDKFNAKIARKAARKLQKQRACLLSQRIRHAIHNRLSNEHAVKYFGCDLKQFKCHLEAQFLPGMTWADYGLWHVDHIKPLSSFNLALESECKLANHYNNLRPLWRHQNLKKGASSVPEVDNPEMYFI